MFYSLCINIILIQKSKVSRKNRFMWMIAILHALGYYYYDSYFGIYVTGSINIQVGIYE